jgi:hypothetical protein
MKIDFSTITRHAGSCVSVFISALTDLLFKGFLTLGEGESVWGERRDKGFPLNLARRVVVQGLVRILSIGSLTPRQHSLAIPLSGFPFAGLILSVAHLSRRFLEQLRTGRTDIFMAPLLKSGMTLCALLVDRPEFRSAFSEISLRTIVRSFALSASSVPLFEPFSPIANESFTFLLLSLTLNPSFAHVLAKHGYSIPFLFYLLSAAELVFTKAGWSPIHPLLFSALLYLVSDPIAVQSLNARCVRDIPFASRAPSGSNFDLLIGVATQACQPESAWPSLAALVHAVSPTISHISVSASAAVLVIFERAVSAKSPSVSLFLDAFATVVQRRQPPENGLPIAIFQSANVFRDLQIERNDGRALGVVLAFLSTARSVIRAQNAMQLTADEAGRLFAEIDVTQTFPLTQGFTRRDTVLEGPREMEWERWTEGLARPIRGFGLDCLWSA